ncbi:hypothetical protein KY333_02215 [Candidatus Woesearchaeota archaeon]|nr:hypothetical protein [Candidatus Woesearchaeota archaeon]MBW2994675.1 hypothetical protein [Candidatus Woesearchaeota archaeon]
MAEQTKGIALAILGVVAVIAIIGLVLMFAKMKTGAAVAGVYGGGLNVGHAARVITDERLLYSGVVEQPNMPQDTPTRYKVEGSWKTGYRQDMTYNPGTGAGTWEPKELTFQGNIPIYSCHDFGQYALVNPNYAKYKDYTATASVQRAQSEFDGKCVNLKVNGRYPIAGLCCYQPANRMY